MAFLKVFVGMHENNAGDNKNEGQKECFFLSDLHGLDITHHAPLEILSPSGGKTFIQRTPFVYIV